MAAVVQESYALTPVQQGMLFHRVHGGNPGVDIEQVEGTLREGIDLDAFERAWRTLAARYPILRTRFAWEGLDSPKQEVMSEVPVTLVRRDLRGLDSAEQAAEIERYLGEDRARGFDFATAPLWHVAMFQTGHAESRIVWTYSHALLDNSFGDVLLELFEAYEADVRGAPAPEPEVRTAFGDHIAWLGEQLPANRDAARAFFRERLAGFSTPTNLDALARPQPAEDGAFEGYGVRRFRLSRATTDAIVALDAHGVRASVVVEAAWGLVLAAFAAQDDAVFGVTRACRRTSVPGADRTIGLFINTLPTRVKIDPAERVIPWLQGLRAQQVAMRAVEHTPLVDALSLADVPRTTTLFDTIVIFNSRHIATRLKSLGGGWEKRDLDQRDQTNFACSLMAYADPEMHFKLSYDRRRFDDAAMNRVAALMTAILAAVARDPTVSVGELPRLTPDEAQKVLVEWNETSAPFSGDQCVHLQIGAQTAACRDRTAVVFRDRAVTYAELDARASGLASRLRAAGVNRGARVGIFVERSIEMVVGLLAILKAGAAYVPLDPSYPSERIAMMVEDAGTFAIVTVESQRGGLPPGAKNVIAIDEAAAKDAPGPVDNQATGEDIAYVIFTSGSTGRPKGVMIRHRNVTAFFAGMDAVLGTTAGTWLALTSISFDISVLEILWTLARGFTVVVQEEAERVSQQVTPPAAARGRKMDFSLFYFAADAARPDGSREGAYRLLLEGAKFADEHGFAAVWTPERHFHPFGGLYPNPALTSAALAVVTKRIALRAGSVVLPLHHPIRCAEEWSVVDNLSNGRVGLSFASGWHASDFALAPQNFADRRRLMSEGIETVRALWRGEAVPATSGDGKAITVRMFPPSVQRQPPIWITASGSPDTFVMAAKIGANILTNLLVMSAADLAKNVATYRAAWRAAGHAGEGHVSLMLHTFVGDDAEEVKSTVRGPFLEYLRTSTDLINKARWELTAFAKPSQQSAPEKGVRDLAELSNEEMDAIMEFAFERYFSTAGLFGTPRSCLATIDRLKELGVDEVACLLDFGVDVDTVLASLRKLDELRLLANAAPEPAGAAAGGEDYAIAAQIRRHRVTHMQCTPSLAAILASDTDALASLGELGTLLLGGEALPESLVARLLPVLRGRLMNMYGPTETTIWSTCGAVEGATTITLGRPIANTRVYVVDGHLRPVPPGVPGELLIGGAGVVAGYLDRPELTKERFVPDPWSDREGDRLYRTGDVVRWRSDGRLEFLGRIDHQVKIRGYRIELGEIESALARHPSVRDAVVVARRDDGEDARLVAYVIPRDADDGSSSAGWREIWNEAYAAGAKEAPDATLDTSGWTSSFTGEAIPEAEMRAWVGETTSRILALGPRRVLEIGCGTGMLLLRVAPKCERYVGVDFSGEAIAGIKGKLGAAGLAGTVALRAMAAEDVTSLGEERFDTVVLNSVAQYFDGADALVNVITRAFALLAPGGRFFLGDLRSLPLLPAFHAAIELQRSPDVTPVDDLHARIERRAAEERELVLDPGLFAALSRALPELAGISMSLKRTGAAEMASFRYDVVLRKAAPGDEAATTPAVVDAPVGATLDALRALLGGAPAVRIRGIPDARTADLALAANCVARKESFANAGDLRARARGALAGAIDPESTFDLDPAYEVVPVPSGRAGSFDLVARHRTNGPRFVDAFAPHADARPFTAFTNVPARAAAQGAVGPELRAHLRATLPDYMMPTAFVALEAFPLTPNGKVDRKALPAPDRARREDATAYVAPTNDVERIVATMWQDMLSIDRVGVDQNFFDLGANSLMMVQASGRLKTALRRPVSLVDLFRFRTVRALAEHLGAGANREAAGEAHAKDGAERAQARRNAMARRRDLRAEPLKE